MQDTEFRGLARIRRLRPVRISTWSRDRTGKSPSGKPPRSTDLLIASYNIHKAVGRDRRFDPARIVDVIDEIGADIIALQEADQRFGERAGLLDLEALKRRTGIQAIVKAIPAFFKEDVAAHFTGQSGTSFFHFGFDKAVTCPRHDGLAAVLAYPRGKIARGFDIVNHIRARATAEHVFGKQHQLAVGVDDVAFFGDNTQAVTITIKGQS